MQLSKFYTYYLKKLFKNAWFWVAAIAINVAGFYQRFELNKTYRSYGGNEKFFGYEVNIRTIENGKVFWFWILTSMFVYLFFWLISGMTSTVSYLIGTSVSEPKENGEDAFFLSYTSPTKRNDLVWAKFLAGFTFFMVANLLYSLSAIFWWIKYAQGYLDYLYIFFHISLAPVLFFCLLVVPLFYFASKFSAKAVRISINYAIPILSSFLAMFTFFLLNRVLRNIKNTVEGVSKMLWDAIKLFDYSFLIVLAFALFCLLIGFVFFYLYQKKFQKKDIT